MRYEIKQAIFIDVNKAVKTCHKCENFKILPKVKPDFPLYFCVNSNEIYSKCEEKYLPCIVENVSQNCMANFLIKDINFSEKTLFSLD